MAATCSDTTNPPSRVYLGAAGLLGVQPDELMMVAAHHDDLDAAGAAGLQTAYVERPYEYGRDVPPKDVSAHPEHPLHMSNLAALATHLGL